MHTRPFISSIVSSTVVALLLGVLPGCQPPPPKSQQDIDLPQDCPEAPPAMSRVEAAQEMTRFAREARANLMVPIQGLKEKRFATLHPPGLALLEAVLASPGKADKMDVEWLNQHLLSAYVEIQSRTPLESLDGDMDRVVIRDDKGLQARVLHMTTRSDSQGTTYRFSFDPHIFDQERERLKIFLELPLGGETARAAWHLRQSVLQEADTLPVIYLMARSRAVRQARWSLLLGRSNEAREILKEELACAPDLGQARTLLQALKRLDRPAAVKKETLALSMAKVQQAARSGVLTRLGHDPVRELMLRSALLERMVPFNQAGLVSREAIQRAQTALREGARMLAAGDLGWGLPSAITEFDRVMAMMLASALDGKHGAATPIQAAVVVSGGPDVSAGDVQVELAHRVLLANAHLVPRWVRGPKSPAAAAGKIKHLHLLELKPVLRAENDGFTLRAKLHQRLGWGWLHPGLPALRYATTFVDHSAEYWRSKLRSVRSKKVLGPIARMILMREIHSPDPAVAGLAMSGLVQINSREAIPILMTLIEKAPPGRRGLALKALALLRDQQVSAAIKQAASAAQPELKAAALEALGIRGLAAERGLLRSGLSDANVGVMRSALLGLLMTRDPRAMARAEAWVMGGDTKLRDLVLKQLIRLKITSARLKRDLPRLALKMPYDLLVSALVSALGDRAARPLSRLYDMFPAHRAMLVGQAGTSAGFTKFLLKAAKENDPTIKRNALTKLAFIKKSGKEVFRKALEDPDAGVRLAAHVGLARQGQVTSLLALGAGARGSCSERTLVIPTLARSMDHATRRKLFKDALASPCKELHFLVWEKIVQFQPDDIDLLVTTMSHDDRTLRLMGALAALGQRTGAVLGKRR